MEYHFESHFRMSFTCVARTTLYEGGVDGVYPRNLPRLVVMVGGVTYDVQILKRRPCLQYDSRRSRVLFDHHLCF